MSESHGKSKRTKTGAKRKSRRDKIKAELGRETPKVTIGETKRVVVKTRGNTRKATLRKTDFINVLDPKTKKITKTKIVTVLENNANRHYVRMNILSKGAFVKTQIGDAKITSRPAQDGIVNGVLVGKK